jgi:hypothetical protein
MCNFNAEEQSTQRNAEKKAPYPCVATLEKIKYS